MNATVMLGASVFAAVSSGILLIYLLVGSRRTRLDDRLEELGSGRDEFSAPAPPSRAASQFATVTHATLPKMGTAMIPTNEEDRSRLQARLLNAGLYHRQAMAMFLGSKAMLMVAPALVGLIAGLLEVFPMQPAVMGGACLGIFGMIGPSFWLDHRATAQQNALRRSLPDALDVMVICLEGGLSLQGAIHRVTSELQTAHPTLARELSIIEREIQLGRPPGESLHQMGIRTGLEEVRNLASVVAQSERFGASLVRSLRVHGENLRVRRQQAAEERAQKAAVKVLFPTLICIFPAIFVVILGPAAFRVASSFAQ